MRTINISFFFGVKKVKFSKVVKVTKIRLISFCVHQCMINDMIKLFVNAVDMKDLFGFKKSFSLDWN